MESEEDLELQEQLFTLKRTAKQVDENLVTITNRLKVAQQKLKVELEELSQTELRSRPSLRRWLKARQLVEDCSFVEFFEAFLLEHEKEFRLNLSDRTISLNKDGCLLFGFKEETIVCLLEVLERLPLLYH
jgi:hypothetical protein